QHGGVVLGLWGLAGHSHKHALSDAGGYQQRLALVQNYSAVTAACLLLRRELYWQVGGLNEQALTVAFNDVDLCLKIQAAGYRNLWTPYAALYHFESKSRGREDTPEKKARERAEINYMQQTWPTQIADDPCYSPHLTRQREDYSIAADEPAAVVGIIR
ncbi:MAG: glycosyltransferase family 2 protein, partial [Chromatiaceae bacterium]